MKQRVKKRRGNSARLRRPPPLAHPDFGWEYDWDEVAWSKAASPYRPLCAVCHGALPDVPVILWNGDGNCASFCDTCAEDLFATL